MRLSKLLAGGQHQFVLLLSVGALIFSSLLLPEVTAGPPDVGVASVADGAASDVIGQLSNGDFSQADYTTSGANDSASSGVLNTPSGVAVDATNHRLFVSDTFNNRVLVFDLTVGNLLLDRRADKVLGQSNMEVNGPNREGPIAANSLYSPRGLAYDSAGNRLFVSDEGNDRVLVYDVATIENGENAVAVLGRPNFTTSNPSSFASQSGLEGPRGLALDSAGNRLFVGDYSYHRVMVFDVAAIADGENAVNVLGQGDFTSNDANRAGAVAANTLNNPYGLAYSGNRLFVADSSNNRVLVYNVAAITNGEDAVNVLGQAAFNTSAAATTQSGLKGPQDLAFGILGNDAETLQVADTGNNRILIYLVAAGTIADGELATAVLGQANFTSGSANRGGDPTAGGLREPIGVTLEGAGRRLWVADSTNYRVVSYDLTAIVNGADAIDLVGQINTSGDALFTTQLLNGGTNNRGLQNPRGLVVDTVNHRLFVADEDNNRVLVFSLNSLDQLVDRQPDALLGQTSFTSATSATTSTGLWQPAGLAYDSTGNRLFVADRGNRRVLVYDVAEIVSGEAAISVLGQANFTSNVSATTQSGFDRPEGLAYDSAGNRLFVADYSKHRVLVYDVATIDNGENAAAVLGQADFTSSTTATTPSGLNSPRGLAYDSGGNRLFVADQVSNRVVVYDVASIGNGEDAINVLGQDSFTSASGGLATASKITDPTDVTYDPYGSRIFVADSGSSRVMIFDVATITDGQAAAAVLGQADFTSWATNRLTGVALNTLYWPDNVGYDTSAGMLYVSDTRNNRVLLFTASLAGGSVAVNGGATYANTITTTLALTATSATTVRMSESPAFTGASFQAYSSTVPFTLTVGDGSKTVYARFRNSSLDPSAAVSDTIILDTTAPAAFALTSPVTGTITNTTSPTFNWDASSDATSGLAKYQLWVDGALNRDNIIASTTSITATSALTDGVHTWKVVAVDIAGNSRESSATSSLTMDTAAPSISEVSISAQTGISATVTWTTNEVSSSQVEYGLTEAYGSATTEIDTATRVISHAVPLTGLSGATYHYRVKSRDQAGNLAVSADNTFSTVLKTYFPLLPREHASGW